MSSRRLRRTATADARRICGASWDPRQIRVHVPLRAPSSVGCSGGGWKPQNRPSGHPLPAGQASCRGHHRVCPPWLSRPVRKTAGGRRGRVHTGRGGDREKWGGVCIGAQYVVGLRERFTPPDALTDLPYSPYVASITELVRSGQLGRLLHIVHLEPIGYYHFAHSYVRGNWQSEKTSAPIILTKSSHDLDLFNRWLWPLVPNKVASFGGLGHFRNERKPEEARAAGVMRCLECPASVEQRCEYSAKRSTLSLLSHHCLC